MTRLVRRPLPPGWEAGDGWPGHVPALLRRIYAARGALDPAAALPRLAHLPPPAALGGIDAATALLAEAIAGDRHIVVVGDFDCDGATACAVAVRGLRLLGATRVSPAVPNRMVHGYGLSPALVDELAALDPALLVTVDHGVACHAGIAAARARGWQVLVTDHHLPGADLPCADAIVNPNLPGDGFPSKALAGVGVVFYVLLALRQRMREVGSARATAVDLGTLLDLVAVGTIADLVPLDACNRALVGAGLRRIRSGQASAGVRALVEVSGRDEATVSAADIGYAVAPRLNAAGRLEDMGLGIACLLADEPTAARGLAARLDAINTERRERQAAMVEMAEHAAAAVPAADPGHVLCLFDPDWHPGLVGLVASRLKDRLHRPVVAFAPAEPGSTALRGSARSIPGFHVRDALADVHARHPGLVERFGGHAMAAGLSLRHDALDAFRDAFATCAGERLDAAMLQAELRTDGALAAGEFTRANAELLRDAGPWGQGFDEPVFDGAFDVVRSRPVAGRHLRMDLADGTLRVPAIHFGGWDGAPPPPRVRIAFRLEPDDYRGGDAVQLVVVHREPA